MNHWLKIGLGSLVLGLAAYAANAENVTISTFYPSPYGSYTQLDTATLNVTGASTLAAVTTTGNITSSADVVLNGSGSDINATSVANGLRLSTSGTTRMTIDNASGNVGIGGTPTTERLFVNGRLRLTESGNQGYLAVSCNGTVCSSSSALYS